MDVEIEQAVREAVREAAAGSKEFPISRLEEMGWGDLLEADAEAAVRAFFEEQGRLVLSSGVLDSVLVGALADERFSWPDVQVIYPLPGSTAAGERASVVEGISFGASADIFLVPVVDGDVVRVGVVDRGALTVIPVEGIDASAGMVSVSVDGALVRDEGIAVDAWDVMLIAGRRALAHELIGLASRMLEIAVEHVSVREQFGKPLGANQAVQHRLADARVFLEAAGAIANESWVTDTALCCLAAKAQASRAFDLVSTHGQQVLGAIGYTWEHEWRTFVRRGFLLTVLLGGADEAEAGLGSELVASGVPRIGALYPENSK